MQLITIGFSHYCEKARWALDLHGQTYEEAAFAPIYHVPAARRAGGRTVPILVTEQRTLTDSTEILKWLETQSNGPLLYGSCASQTAEIESTCVPFDRQLGPAARRLLYFHLFRHPTLAKGVFATAMRDGQKWQLAFVFPLARFALRRYMNINDASAERSTAVIDEHFEQVAVRLSDGRPFLMGDRLTAADVTFACMAAPVILPTEYGWPLPKRSELSADVIAIISRYRETPAGQHVLRMFADYRGHVSFG